MKTKNINKPEIRWDAIQTSFEKVVLNLEAGKLISLITLDEWKAVLELIKNRDK